MPRTLSAGIQSQISRPSSEAGHLLTFGPVNGTTYYFGEDLVIFGGHTYLPHLIGDFAVKFTQKLQLDPVSLHLQNVSLEMAAIVNTQRSDIQGAPATLSRFWPAINEALVLFSGVVTEIDVDEKEVLVVLAGDLDPTASQVPKRTYMATCSRTFKDASCGYVNGVDPNDPGTGLPYVACPKDFVSCTARGRKHRFDGFIHIQRDLTLAYEGVAPDAAAPQRTLASLLRPWEEM